MRKPLLVVCGVTAAVLLAGGITATTAGADETPDQPGVPGVQMPDLSNFPQFPWLAGADTTDDADPVGATGTDDQAGDDSQSADANQTSGDNGFPDRPGGQDQAATAGQHAAADDKAQPTGATRGQPKPAAQAAAQPAARPQTASLTSSAQRELSPGQVSTSATAPFQQQVLALINQNRRQGGCEAVTLDRRLILAAYGHAADMARRNYFAHESLNGDGAGDRVTDAGFQWSRYGENIARGPSSADEVVDGWMHSPVHRENIMDCRFREMGIGLAFSGDKESYWVQDFATPRD